MCLQNCKKSPNLDLNKEHETLELQYWDISCDFLGNCNYIELDECKSVESTKQDLCILQLNVRGLIGKQQQLPDLLCKCTQQGKIDVLILVETWLTKESMSHINMPGYSYVAKIRKTKKGSGVGFLVRNNLAYKIRDDLDWDSDHYEACFIEIKSNLHNIICGFIHHQIQTPNYLLKSIKSALENCNWKKSPL